MGICELSSTFEEVLFIVFLRPRDGKNVTFFQLKNAVMEVYNVSGPFAAILAGGGVITCGNGFRLNLADLAAHNKIEHDASMVNLESPAGDKN